MITVGIDCGARNIKIVVLRDGNIAGKDSVPTGFDQEKATNESLDRALKEADLSKKDIQKIAGTGSYYKAIKMAGIRVNDIKAISKAANFFFPNARTVIDVGAEESRVVKIGQHGNILDFAINEKRAAGAGSFIETMARALEIPLDELGALALESNKKILMNAQCVIFAESEVVSLIHAKIPKADISKAIHDSMANRIVSMILRIGIHEDVTMIGGVAHNPGMVEAVKQKLQVHKIYVPENPEFGAAVGAAVVAAEETLT